MGLRVLVVDDSRLMRVLLCEAVRASGVPLEVLADAADGEQALHALRRSPFDLVLTDLQMPRLDGFGLIAAIAGLPAAGTLRVVTITSETGQSLVDRISRMRVHAHLTKPVTFEAIRDVLREVWELGRAAGTE